MIRSTRSACVGKSRRIIFASCRKTKSCAATKTAEVSKKKIRYICFEGNRGTYVKALTSKLNVTFQSPVLEGAIIAYIRLAVILILTVQP